MSPKYADIIIDVGSRDTAGLRAALTVADVALVPFQPRSFDLWTLDKVASLITERRSHTVMTHFVLWAVLNFADPAGLDNAAAAEALSGNEVITYLAEMAALVRAVFNGAAIS